MCNKEKCVNSKEKLQRTKTITQYSSAETTNCMQKLKFKWLELKIIEHADKFDYVWKEYKELEIH